VILLYPICPRGFYVRGYEVKSVFSCSGNFITTLRVPVLRIYTILKKLLSKSRLNFPDAQVPNAKAILKYVQILSCWFNFRQEKTHKRLVETEEKLDDICTRLERSPRKLPVLLAQQTVVSSPSA
jgi:hypothetical protein